ncbi:MAG: chorismate--pyruvate lyase family protein [Bryobacteraceae bacterium]
MAFLSQVNGVDPKSLGLLQRIFLVNDGTLTDTVEAAVLEPIRLTKLSGAISPAAAPAAALDLEAGETVMDRAILLSGETTGRNYVYAQSQLALDRLPAGFRRELLDSNKPMGRLWSEYRLETWKELLSVTRGPAPGLAAHFPGGEHEDMLRRQYRVVSGGRPLMIITEWFPARYRSDPAPSHCESPQITDRTDKT